MEAIGIEGVAGFIITTFLLIIFNNIKCTPMYDSNGNVQFCPFGVFEDTILAFKQMGENPGLCALVICYILGVVYVAYAQTVIIKFGSSMQRAMMICLRSLCVWCTSLVIQWEDFIWLQLVGFIVLVFGVMIFKEVIVFPCWGCNEGIDDDKKDENEKPKEINDKINEQEKEGVKNEDVKIEVPIKYEEVSSASPKKSNEISNDPSPTKNEDPIKQSEQK